MKKRHGKSKTDKKLLDRKILDKKTIEKFIFWTPRILSILFILFLTMFSLDIFDLGLGFWGTVLGLLIHNIPSFVLTIILIISWKYEIVGGIGYIFAGLFFFMLMLVPVLFRPEHEWSMLLGALIISLPAFIIGALFLVGWFRKRR
ncbi:hypothetical protein KY362_01990 [Candidatus Woesearchaeota archaeon]|nr:hypothetical protein [Candidatus Woesearchaeota archaeon]